MENKKTNEQQTAIKPGAVAFNPNEFLIVPARTFEDLKLGEVFRAPSRTLTDAHASAFQTVSCDNHPIHYDAVYAKKYGHIIPGNDTDFINFFCKVFQL